MIDKLNEILLVDDNEADNFLHRVVLEPVSYTHLTLPTKA